MNNPIKFRVWCQNFNEWEKDRILIATNGDIYHLSEKRGLRLVNPETHIVQRFTGVFDKEGKAIYEGDICKAFTANDDTEFIAPVKFDPYEGFFLDSRTESWDRIVYDGGVRIGNKVEVIGNIFENPELKEKFDLYKQE